MQRSKKPQQLRGLNANHNHDLKNIFKGAATMASISAGPFHDFYEALLTKGMQPTMARLTLARKIAARSIPGIIILDGWPIGLLRRSGSRESINRNVQTTVDFTHGSLRYYPMPPRTTEESYRPRVSDRTMVGNSAIVMLVSFKKRMGAVTTVKWNHREKDESHRFV